MMWRRWCLVLLLLLPMFALWPRPVLAAPPPEALQAAREGAKGYGSGLGPAFPVAHREDRLLYETWLFQLAGGTTTMAVTKQPEGWAVVSYSTPGSLDLEALERAQALLAARGLPEDQEPAVFSPLPGMRFWLLRAEGQEFLFPMGASRDGMIRLGLSPDELHHLAAVERLLPRLMPRWYKEPQIWFALFGWALLLTGAYFLVSMIHGLLRGRPATK